MIIYLSLSLLFISSIFAAQTPDHTDYTIRTGTGQATKYVVAEYELHNLTRDRAEIVTSGNPRQQARTVGDADVRDLVLYPKDGARNEWTRRVLTREVLVRLAAGTDVAQVAKIVDAIAAPEVSYAPRHYILRVTQPGAALEAAVALAGVPGV